MAQEKQTEKEIEVKEFISKPAGGTNHIKQKAARAKHSYRKKSMQIDNDTTPRIVYPTIVINANLKSNGGSGISTDPYIIDSLSK